MHSSPKSASWIRRLDMLTMRLFLTVSEEGSLNRAAARELMTPSTATKRIQALEDGLGVRLIDRGTKGLTLTTAGEIVARHMRASLDDLEALHLDLTNLLGAVSGSLRVAANASSWVAYLANDVAEFGRAFPSVSLELRDGATPEVLRAVLANEADVGICPMNALAPTGLAAIPYRKDRLVAVMSPSHSASSAESLTLQQLLQCDLVGWSARGSLMRTLQQAAGDVAISFQPRYRMSSVDSARALVRAGLGVTVLPDSMVRPFEDETQLVAVPIAEKWAERSLYVFTRDRRSGADVLDAFVEHLTRK
jgi:DNA-binding transcriptional LysR family regulator